MPVGEGGLHAKIFQHFSVLSETVHENGDWTMEIEGDKADMAWLQRQSGYSVAATG